MRKTVLVADDYPDSAALLCQLIEMKGDYETVAASDGRDALARLSERHIDIAILDVEMPVLGGVETAQRMRESLGDARPLLIAVTGRAYLAEVTKSGLFDHVFEKPVAPAELLRVLDGV